MPDRDLETQATHAQAHAGPHSKIWRAAEDKEGGGGQGVRRSARGWHIRGAGGHIATRDQHYLGQVGIFLEE